MQIDAIVASFEGIEPELLNDADTMRGALHAAVAAGGFQLLNLYLHQFQPQGLTATAVLSESHIALHSWPEDGALFVDLATCSGPAPTEAAFRRLCAVYSPTFVDRRDVDLSSRRRSRVAAAPAHAVELPLRTA